MSARTLTATEKLQQEARERWGKATPFRIGYLAASSPSIEAQCNPYEPNSRGYFLFLDGMASALAEKQRTQP